jgi:hypothetical protein
MDKNIRPFHLSDEDLRSRIDEMIDVTFNDITSQFLLMPRGSAFIEYPEFSNAYEVLKRHTEGFRSVNLDVCLDALTENSRVFGVLRAILGFTAPEWAEIASEDAGFEISQNAARTLDRKCRETIEYYSKTKAKNEESVSIKRIVAMVNVAIKYIKEGAGTSSDDLIHRLSKIDTQHGIDSVIYCSDEHVPYAALLYERYLGGPFASHRNAVSELVGEVMEDAIEQKLRYYGVSFKKTGRAERIPGFGQAPDFCIPDEHNPAVIIEAKITSDDGTARDKVARIKELETQSKEHVKAGNKPYQVVACIDGRGFKQRREDMKQMLIRLNGKVFTSKTLDQLITATDISKFVTRN